jgi:hypothetical protein
VLGHTTALALPSANVPLAVLVARSPELALYREAVLAARIGLRSNRYARLSSCLKASSQKYPQQSLHEPRRSVAQ